MTDAKAEMEELGNLRPYTADMRPRPTKGWDAARYRSEDVIAAGEAVDMANDELATVVDAQGAPQTMPIAAFKAMSNGARSFAAAGMATPSEPMTPEMWDMKGSDALWALATEWGQEMPASPQDRSRRREAQRSHWEQIREHARTAAEPRPTKGWDAAEYEAWGIIKHAVVDRAAGLAAVPDICGMVHTMPIAAYTAMADGVRAADRAAISTIFTTLTAERWAAKIEAAKIEAELDQAEPAHTVASVAKEARAKAQAQSAGQGQRKQRPAHGQRPKGR